MKNKKGQALVEFVIILPVMLLLIFSIIDFGIVIYEKNNLENVISDAVTFYENGESLDTIKNTIKNKDDLDILIENKDVYVVMEIKKSIEPITPGLNYFIDKVFDIKTSRVIKND